MTKKTKTIHVNYLARVEGEGALYVRYDDSGVQDVQLNIFEPPRFFEAFLQGRDYSEAPDITARICGICPVAYQMSAVHAIEQIAGFSAPAGIRALRRLLYCGEWIESHVLHIAMLHAPDFLGYESAVAMAKDHPDIVSQSLELKKAGNAIVNLLGGREIHPINVRVGGFYKLPGKQELQKLAEQLKAALVLATGLTRWLAGLSFPDFQRGAEPYQFVALSHPNEYPMNEGRLLSSSGMNLSVNDFEQHFIESHVAHSNALHCLINGREPYFVGPMARFNLNFDRLSTLTKDLARDIGFSAPCNNPFQSILIRALEVVYAIDEALRIIADYQAPERPFEAIAIPAGTGHAVTEAPRGLLYHRYQLDEAGKILEAKIVPPTSQNQKTIEDDLRLMIPQYLELPKEQLQHQCEQAIRNYDPCISCATHFLKLELDKQ